MNYSNILDLLKKAKPAINRARYFAEQWEQYHSDRLAEQSTLAQADRDSVLMELRSELNDWFDVRESGLSDGS